MEELIEIAEAHYNAGSPEIRRLAEEFFKALDTNGDRMVDLHEFLSFMREDIKYARMCNRSFFEELDRDKNGRLDFSEVMALFYIVNSGRPFCSFCDKFIPGVFFSCVECYENPGSDYILCLYCYRLKFYKHKAYGHLKFLDNYTLLQSQKKRAVEREKKPIIQDEVKSQHSKSPVPSNAIVAVPTEAYGYGYMNINNPGPSFSAVAYPYCPPPTYQHHLPPPYPNHIPPPYPNHLPPPYPNLSNAIVPAAPNNQERWKLALKALEMAIMAAVWTSSCTIL